MPRPQTTAARQVTKQLISQQRKQGNTTNSIQTRENGSDWLNGKVANESPFTIYHVCVVQDRKVENKLNRIHTNYSPLFAPLSTLSITLNQPTIRLALCFHSNSQLATEKTSCQLCSKKSHQSC
jgi:hypothetical protein